MLPTNIWIAEQKISPKKVLVYALGGGNGHIQRANLIAQQFSDATIMHQKESPFSSSIPVIHPQGKDLVAWSVETLMKSADSHDCVVVDTFPKGVGHEITQEIIQRYESSFLVARYVREEMYHDYKASCSWYTDVWIPYCLEKCEWDNPPNGVYTGVFTRPIEINNDQVSLCVIGNLDLIPKRWFSLFPVHTTFINHRFHTLPNAKRYLCVGAGYNLFWELNSLDLNVAHMPVEKRYDDQFRRTMRFGLMVSTYQDLFDFLKDCS
ncbi:MAG: hypothetical protein CL916_00505 [Deltaproteobacteria bacterium]|nr:hypothetical protein [Deltaproteobacteria bacterium]